jgi:hypothetical protein
VIVRLLPLVRSSLAGQGWQPERAKMATIASLPYCEHGDHDEDVFPRGQVTRCAS